MPRRFIALLLLALVATTGTVQAQSTTKPAAPAPTTAFDPPTRIAKVGGALFAVKVRGDLAYLAQGPRLRIMNVADPAQPVLVGESTPVGESIYDLALDGDRAYVKTLDALTILDVSDPADITTLGTIAIQGSKIAVSGSYVFVKTYGAWIARIDVSNPAAPVAAGGVTLPRFGSEMVVQGRYVYAAVYDYGIRIIDGQTAGNPTTVGSYDPPGRVETLALAGNYAYLTNIDGMNPFGLRILDVSTPSAPRLVASYDTPGTPNDVAVDGTYAYVADGNTLLTLDITNPAQPTANSSLDIVATDVEVSDGTAYLLNYAEGAYKGAGTDSVRIVDVSDPPNAAQVGTLKAEPFAIALDMKFSNGHSFVVTQDELVVSSIADPSSPMVVARLSIPRAQTVTIAGRYAYVVTQQRVGEFSGTMQIVDIGDPSTPVLKGSIAIGDARITSVAGRYVYTIATSYTCNFVYNTDCIRTYDVSDPANPQLIATGDLKGRSYSITVIGRYGYSVSDGVFCIFDLVDPNQPKQVSRTAVSGSTYLSVSYPTAYLYSIGGVDTFDISNPVSPTLRNRQSFEERQDRKTALLDGSLAYVTANGGDNKPDQLIIYSLPNTGTATKVAAYPISSRFRDLAVYGTTIFLNEGADGITILRWQGQGLVRSEQTVQYDTWTSITNASALGKTYRSATAGNVSIATPATTSIDWITFRGPSQGKARVTIDGVDKGIVDLYATSKQYQAVVTFGGLSATPHQMQITVLGQKNAASSGVEVQVDAFRYGTTTIGDDDYRVRYGNWTGVAQAAAADGSYRLSAVAGRTAVFRFAGTAFTILSARGPAYGKADIYVDGVLRQQVDLYSATQTWQVPIKIGPLDRGAHTVQLRVTGTKNTASTGTSVVFDGYNTP